MFGTIIPGASVGGLKAKNSQGYMTRKKKERAAAAAGYLPFQRPLLGGLQSFQSLKDKTDLRMCVCEY